jgi:hypothetical protein
VEPHGSLPCSQESKALEIKYLYMKGDFLNQNPVHTAYCAYEFPQNGPSPLIHGVINIPNIGFSFKKSQGGEKKADFDRE